MYQQVGIVYGCASVGDVVGRGIERKFKKELGLVIVLRVSQESVNRGYLRSTLYEQKEDI